jgi:large subunit ribosomal protein L24e
MSVESRKYKCVVCGRSFPRGQGVIITIEDLTLEFHSNKCFSKFARELLKKLPSESVKGYAKRLVEEYREIILQKSKLKSKKI